MSKLRLIDGGADRGPRRPTKLEWREGRTPVVRPERPRSRRRAARAFRIVLWGALIAGATVEAFLASPWPVGATARHILAAPSCAAARAVGLAPARRGRPGYYVAHDLDVDGVACEPYRR